MNTTDFTAMVQYAHQIQEAEHALARRAFVDDSEVLEPRRTLRERLRMRLMMRRSRAAQAAQSASAASSAMLRGGVPRHQVLTH